MKRILICTLALALTGCASTTTEPADQLYVNGRVYAVDDNDRWFSSFAVRDGEIVALSDDGLEQYRGSSTQVVDLEGRFVMPGIQDMHLHPVDGGLAGRFECTFPDTLTAEEIVAFVAACIEEAEPGEWIQGGQWGPLLEIQNPEGLLAMLDAVSPENPVFLMDWSVHNAWLNSLAFEAVGIDATSTAPKGGVIGKDEDGSLSGILYDNAAYVARNRIPAYTTEQVAEAITFSVERMLGHGITSMKDAIVTKRNLLGYQHLAENGELNMRVKGALAWKSAWSRTHEEEVELTDTHEQQDRERFDASFAKIMLDGIPPTYTAAVLEPYNATPEFGDAHIGKLMHDPETLAQDVTELDAKGLTVKIHATGDRSVRVALDAFEAARKANGPSGLRHEISHAEMIHPDDLPRFAELNVAAEMCPILWYPGPAVQAMEMALGERAQRFWPVKSFIDSGALVFYGSDWPSVVPDTNPWPGIEAMVSREDPYGQFEGQLWPEQAVDLATALRIFTINGAVAGKHDAETGSLEVGKRADFIVLDRNPFEIPVADISELKVLRTFVDGVEVWAQ